MAERQRRVHPLPTTKVFQHQSIPAVHHQTEPANCREREGNLISLQGQLLAVFPLARAQLVPEAVRLLNNADRELLVQALVVVAVAVLWLAVWRLQRMREGSRH